MVLFLTIFCLFSFALFSIYLALTFPPIVPPKLLNAQQYFLQVLKYLENVAKTLSVPFFLISLFPTTLYPLILIQYWCFSSLGLGHNTCPVSSFHHSVLDPRSYYVFRVTPSFGWSICNLRKDTWKVKFYVVTTYFFLRVSLRLESCLEILGSKTVIDYKSD